MRKALCIVGIILALGLAAACGGGSAPLLELGLGPTPTPQPERLDLSGQGVTDIEYLKAYTGLKQLDLRDNDISVADYRALAAALPGCDILWSVPVANQRVDNGIDYLRADRFSTEDVETLGCLPSLKSVNAEGCTDYDALLAAAERYPDIDFAWTVSVAGKTFSSGDTSIDLGGADVSAPELLEALRALPAAAEVNLRGATLEDADKLALITEFPARRFGWTVEVLPGVTADSADETVDLRGNRITDVDAVIEKMRLLPDAAVLDMCECGPSNDEMMRVREALPGTKVVWMVDVACFRIRTDLVGFSMGVLNRFPNGGGYLIGVGGHAYGNGDFDNLKYCTDLVALDIGHCTAVTDLSFIAEMPSKLKYLIVAMTYVSDISVLADQTELVYLEFFDCRVSDITPIRNCQKLRCLNCSNNPFTDLETLKSLKSLERLWMTASRLTDEQLDELKATFPDALINVARDRTAGDHLWRRGNWDYVDMQRIYGMRAQFQYGITPTPEPTPAATPAP